MWLLNSRTLELTLFFDSSVPSYAILSHRWENEEVTFQDMQSASAPRKAGYAKIMQCCRQAVKDGYDFAWIDTCCIDKSSSAELSEAINSMYQWYKNAAVCYAYLTDVLAAQQSHQPNMRVWPDIMAQFKASKWFTRGWTLQELIAPSNLLFFTSDWNILGTKASLSLVLGEITGIDQNTLAGRDIGRVSIAKRMSWASKRVTTRKEDIAYCLIGIFGVNMPLMYGEGEKAFFRLQEEIMKDSDDQSLFAWEDCCHSHDKLVVNGPDGPLRGPLALSPAEFANSGDIVPYRDWQCSLPYTMTNNGLRIELPMHTVREDDTGLCLGVLGCYYEGDFRGPIGIFLRPLRLGHRNKYNDGLEGDQYARDHERRRPVVVDPGTYFRPTQKTIFLRKDVLLPTNQEYDRKYSFLVRLFPENSNFNLIYVYPLERWTKAKGNMAIIRWPSCKAAVLFEGSDGTQFLVTMRIDLPVPHQENDRWKRSRCTCKIFVSTSNEWIVGNASDQVYLEEPVDNIFEFFKQLAKYGSNKTFEHLKEGQIVIAEIKKEIVMGERMFVVDVDIQSEDKETTTEHKTPGERRQRIRIIDDLGLKPKPAIHSRWLHEMP